MTVTVGDRPGDLRIEAGSEADLRLVKLPHTRSHILAAADGRAWAFPIRNGKGLFTKDDPNSVPFARGRRLCDLVMARFHCGGFLTTDELPRYGLSRHDRDDIFNDYHDANPASDVLILLVYDDLDLAVDIRKCIVAELEAEFQLT
jgi:Glu-tRNA(Gln) amidotransferase subunit E-like FAD-binding protein